MLKLQTEGRSVASTLPGTKSPRIGHRGSWPDYRSVGADKGVGIVIPQPFSTAKRYEIHTFMGDVSGGYPFEHAHPDARTENIQPGQNQF